MSYESNPFLPTEAWRNGFGDAPEPASPPQYEQQTPYAFPNELVGSIEEIVDRAMQGAPKELPRRKHDHQHKRGRRAEDAAAAADEPPLVQARRAPRTEDALRGFSETFEGDGVLRAGSEDVGDDSDKENDQLIEEAAEHFVRSKVLPPGPGASKKDRLYREQAQIIGDFVERNRTMNGKAIPARTSGERLMRSVLNATVTPEDERTRIKNDTMHLVYYPSLAPSIEEAHTAFRLERLAEKRKRAMEEDNCVDLDATDEAEEENSASCVLCYCTTTSSCATVREAWRDLVKTYIVARLSSTAQMTACLVAAHFNDNTRAAYNGWRRSQRSANYPAPSEEELLSVELPELTPSSVLRHFEEHDNCYELDAIRQYCRLTEAINTLPLWYVNMATGLREMREHNIRSLSVLMQLRAAVTASIAKYQFNSNPTVREILGLGSGK